MYKMEKFGSGCGNIYDKFSHREQIYDVGIERFWKSSSIKITFSLNLPL